MLTINLIPSMPPYNIFKTFTVDSDDIYEAYKYIDTDEYLYREDEGIYFNLGENYKDYYVLEYDTFYALVKKEMPNKYMLCARCGTHEAIKESLCEYCFNIKTTTDKIINTNDRLRIEKLVESIYDKGFDDGYSQCMKDFDM